jgi:hypothetical protein
VLWLIPQVLGCLTATGPWLTEARVIDVGQRPWQVAFSNDGQVLAVVGDYGISTFNTRTWHRTGVAHCRGSSVITAVGSKDFATDLPFGVGILSSGAFHRGLRLAATDEYVGGIACTMD